MQDITDILAEEFSRSRTHVANVIQLIDEGNTIPFIARYRKEMHGTMDDTLLRELSERLEYLRNLQKRRDEVKNLLSGMDKLTDELSSAIDEASTLTEIEDIYRPFRPKRKTRASVAREKGLEPLAEYILAQQGGVPLSEEAAKYVDESKEVKDVSEALQGARDIIAEDISDSALIRKRLRTFFNATGIMRVTAAKDEDSVYSMYYDFSEPVRKLVSHRILAINRGEKEGYLKASVEVDSSQAVKLILSGIVKGDGELQEQVRTAAADSFERLLYPSIEREIRSALTQSADETAIDTFKVNLKNLLMQPPVRNMVTLGFDPAYRTGCKLAVVDGTGKVLDTGVIYPTAPHNKTKEAAKKLGELIEKYDVKLISIGNGTASRESEIFVADCIRGTDVSYVIVNEAGASVYSASELGAKEFPEFDVSLRSAVSIARRIQDPLAELVKIDPKSIGVGQYQHDMPPKELDSALDGVVEDCVNSVGADLNTASPSLLMHIAGINSAISQNIVRYREENGAFRSRSELKKVAKLGDKSFTQCAGFLRVAGGDNVLDNTAVHPESYEAAKKLLSVCGFTMDDVRNGNLSTLGSVVKKRGEASVAEECGIGIPTLRDMVEELMKPGRDPREELEPPILRSDVMSMDDLKEGMILTGTVRNVVDFGAFVDIGVHQDGLVHISRMTDRFIRHPSEVVKTGDIVQVKVTEVDKKRNRIALSMKLGE
ncbi:MAG: RNA-binding transcriptional accessory protein [Eubacteriaceae bacterium]|nr:RNA-binding transcriptional accessory protein [Eubacteriaceae bacterium]